MVCTFGIGLFLPGAASAAFTRRLACQIPFEGGLALDGENDFFTGSFEFEPAYEKGFRGCGEAVEPAGMVPPACAPMQTCYTVTGKDTRAEKYTVGAMGEHEEVRFSCETPECDEYIGGSDHDEITGVPGVREAFGGAGSEGLHAVTVDPEGDIYVTNTFQEVDAVYEYRPSGEFLREFSLRGREVPLLNDEKPRPFGLAFDSVSGHLLVAAAAGGGGGVEVGAIYEFEANEGPQVGRFVDEISESSPGMALQGPLNTAFDKSFPIVVDSRGDVYLSQERAGAVEVYTNGHYFPTPTLAAATRRGPEGASGVLDSAVLNGSVNPAQAKNPMRTPSLSECYFEYVSEEQFQRNVSSHGGEQSEGFAELGLAGGEAECAPSAGEIPTASEEAYAVHASVRGLQAGLTYRYRLLAVSGGALGGSEASSVFAFTAPAPARIVSSSAQGVSAGAGELSAQIDPMGAPTSYHFEYDTREYAPGEGPHGVSVPVPEAAIGSGGPTGSSLASVGQHIGPLQPGATYYFRVVAVNEITEEGSVIYGPRISYGPGQRFTTLPEAAAGDRSYELVTPAVKDGGSDMFASPESDGEFRNLDVGTPASSGEGFFLETESPFGEFPFAVSEGYVFGRKPQQEEWGYESLASRSLGVQSFQSALLDPENLSRVAVNDGLGQREEGERYTNLLGPPGAPAVCEGALSIEQAVAGDCYIMLHQDAPFHENENNEEGAETTIVGASSDLSHIVLESFSGEAARGESELCPGAKRVTHGHLLCEWDGGYEPGDGGKATPQLKLIDEREGTVISACGAAIGNAYGGGGAGSAYGASSSDGSRVLFTAPDPEPDPHGSLNEKEKLEGKEGCWNGETAEKEGAAPVNAPQLYARVRQKQPSGEVRYETIQLSAPEEGVSVPAGKEYPAYYAGASEDGSRVFFITKTWLTANHPEKHDPELYEWRSQHTPAPDGPCTNDEGCLTRISTGQEHQPSRTEGADVTDVVAVASQGTAVYYWATGVLAEGASSGRGGIYRYETTTGTINYVPGTAAGEYPDNAACETLYQPPCPIAGFYTTPDGQFLLFSGPHGLERYDADNASTTPIAPSGDIDRSASKDRRVEGEVHAMSDNGEYVFFDTTEKLVPQATNQEGPNPTVDTYQWHNGGISLIGRPNIPSPTYFLGYNPNPTAHTEQAREGGNVFIGTHAQLSEQDTNNVGNIYDARTCEPESPCIKPPPAETAQCLDGTCQTPPPAPVDQTPASETFSGAGNLIDDLSPAQTKKTAGEIRAENLAKALKTCRKDKSRKKRAACEAQARKQHAPVKAAKKSSTRRRAASDHRTRP